MPDLCGAAGVMMCACGQCARRPHPPSSWSCPSTASAGYYYVSFQQRVVAALGAASRWSLPVKRPDGTPAGVLTGNTDEVRLFDSVTAADVQAHEGLWTLYVPRSSNGCCIAITMPPPEAASPVVVWECCGRDDDDFKVPEDVLVHLQAAQPGRSVCVVCCAFELAVAQSHDDSEEADLAVRLCSTVNACRDSLSAATVPTRHFSHRTRRRYR